MPARHQAEISIATRGFLDGDMLDGSLNGMGLGVIALVLAKTWHLC